MAQRYDIWTYYDTMVTDKDDNGDWVKYDDHYAEITQLRSDLAAERELADRLASAGVNMKRAAELRGNVGFPQMDAALTAHAARRNK